MWITALPARTRIHSSTIVSMLPSSIASNGVDMPGAYRRDRIQQLMTLVNDTTEPEGLWVCLGLFSLRSGGAYEYSQIADVVLHIACIPVLTLQVSRIAGRQLANDLGVSWPRVFR